METMFRLAMAIQLGYIDCGLTLGIERMGRNLFAGAAPKTRITKTNPKVQEMSEVQIAPAHDHAEYFSREFPRVHSHVTSFSGDGADGPERRAEVYELLREEIDAYALESHKKCEAAYEAGVYKDEVIPLEVETPVFDDEGNWVEAEHGEVVTFDRDECIRVSTPEKLAALPGLKGVKSFADKEVVISAGNCCPTNDGITGSHCHVRREGLGVGLGATGPHSRHGRGRCETTNDGRGACGVDQESTEASGLDGGPDRSRGIQRGLCRPGDPLLSRNWIRFVQGECEWGALWPLAIPWAQRARAW